MKMLFFWKQGLQCGFYKIRKNQEKKEALVDLTTRQVAHLAEAGGSL